jgi:hypothetical protein
MTLALTLDFLRRVRSGIWIMRCPSGFSVHGDTGLHIDRPSVENSLVATSIRVGHPSGSPEWRRAADTPQSRVPLRRSRQPGTQPRARRPARPPAAALAAVAAYFSVSGMTEIFPGAPAAIVALAGTMEATKLVTAGWLARHWRSTGGLLRTVLITLVTGLAAINAAGVYGRLVEAHVGVRVAASSSIDERTGALDARIDAQTRTVAGFDQRLGEIDAAIGKLTEKGRAATALNAMASQRRTREALIADRSREAAVLVDLRSERAKLDAERQRAEAANGPIVYMAALMGVPVELAIRWLILLMALTCDPTAIALTVAASRRGLSPAAMTARVSAQPGPLLEALQTRIAGSEDFAF